MDTGVLTGTLVQNGLKDNTVQVADDDLSTMALSTWTMHGHSVGTEKIIPCMVLIVASAKGLG
jgi:hypothetical protein